MRASINLDPDIDPNYMQSLSADDTSRLKAKAVSKLCRSMEMQNSTKSLLLH